MLLAHLKQSEANLYSRGLTTRDRTRLMQVLESFLHIKHNEGAYLVDYLMQLEENVFRLCIQFTSEKISKMLDGEMLLILRRYPTGDNKARMKWRRLCKKHGIDTKPLGSTRSKKMYNRVRYISRKGRGKRIAEITLIVLKLRDAHGDMMDHAQRSEDQECIVMAKRVSDLLTQLELAVAVAEDK